MNDFIVVAVIASGVFSATSLCLAALRYVTGTALMKGIDRGDVATVRKLTAKSSRISNDVRIEAETWLRGQENEEIELMALREELTSRLIMIQNRLTIMEKAKSNE